VFSEAASYILQNCTYMAWDFCGLSQPEQSAERDRCCPLDICCILERLRSTANCIIKAPCIKLHAQQSRGSSEWTAEIHINLLLRCVTTRTIDVIHVAPLTV
jgi:hypothetical protein